MSVEPSFALVGALIGVPARANMMAALMDGRAQTATELAFVAGVTPQTASSHLAKLTEAGLLAVENQGRHRYYRLANPTVAEALEPLTHLTPNQRVPERRRAHARRVGELRLAAKQSRHRFSVVGANCVEQGDAVDEPRPAREVAMARHDKLRVG